MTRPDPIGAAARRQLRRAIGRSGQRSATRRSSPISRPTSISASNIIPAAKGVISFNAFRKSIDGFTTTRHRHRAVHRPGAIWHHLRHAEPHAADRASTRAAAPTAAQVQVTSQVNVPNKLTINGLEFQWVQPLDFLTKQDRRHRLRLQCQRNDRRSDQQRSGDRLRRGAVHLQHHRLLREARRHAARFDDLAPRLAEQRRGAERHPGGRACYGTDYTTYDFSSAFDLDKIFGIARARRS